MRTRIALAAASTAVFTGAGIFAEPAVHHVAAAAATTSSGDLRPTAAPPGNSGSTASGGTVTHPWVRDDNRRRTRAATPADSLATDASFVDTYTISSSPHRLLPVPPPTVAVTPPPPLPPPTDATSVWTEDWQCIRTYESGDAFNSPDAPSGAYGIVEETWESFGMSGWPYEATPAEQNTVALELYTLYGWGPWSSRYACGL